MALESFYGGKQGVSPVIKARFKYVNTEDPAYIARLGNTTKLTKEEARWLNDVFYNTNKKNIYKAWEANEAINTTYVAAGDNTSEKLINAVEWTPKLLKPFTMDECLKDVHYTDVWYGELCIIDTDNKLNPYNGMLFKRTLKQVDNRFAGTELTLYAEYIGQIVGPSGGIPKFDFGSLEAERKKAVGILPTLDTEQASAEKPLDTSNWDYSYPENESGKLTTNNPENDYDKIAIISAGNSNGNTANIQMVPGKVSETKYNDTIKYTWCNVRRRVDGKDDDAWVYLGFEIPYTVYDVTGIEENYTYNGEILIDNSPEGHPFSKTYTFHIPRGARGIGPEDFFIVGKDNKEKPDTLYNFDAITYDPSTDIYSVDSSKIIENPSELTYWVAKWRLYNPKTTNIIDVYQYIGAYKDIAAVRLLNDSGKLQIKYSNKNTWYDLYTLTWIKNIAASIDISSPLSDTYGDFTIHIDYVGKDDYTYTKNLHLIKNATYDSDTGKIIFNYSDDKKSTIGPINDITATKVDENNGHLSIQYRVPHTNNSDDDGWKDLGSIRTKPVISPVLKIKNGNNLPDYSFNSSEDVENLLNSTTTLYVDPEDNTTTVDNKGNIVIKGDNTSGLVVATVNGNNYLYYYDPTQQKWITLGTLGSANSGGDYAKNLIIEEATPTQGEPVQHKFEDDTFVTFKDGTSNKITKTNPIAWPWSSLETNN